MPDSRCETTNVFGTFGTFSPKTQKKRSPQGNILKIFFRYFWIYIFNEKFNSKRHTIRAFLSKKRALFSIFKRAGEASPLPLIWVLVSVAEYALISLNMSTYPWKFLNKLFWLILGFECAWSSYMFDRLLKMPPFLNKPEF